MKNQTDLIQEFGAMRPAGGFNVILADPPWNFKNYSEKGEGKNPNQHYKCISIEEICSIPVSVLASNNCALLMWSTWPFMPRWNEVLKAWGFEYSSLAWEWIKYNPVTDKYAFGPGYGTRKNLEPCLLATKGSPKIGSHSIRDFIRSPRREHSRKPEEQYELIERLFPAGPYIEIFARNEREGWTAWGNETEKFSNMDITDAHV